MAMENSSALSNDASKETSSASTEDLTTLGSSTAAHVGDDTTQNSNTEESLLDDKPKDVLDPEGDFVDAEAVPEDVDVDVGAPDAAGVNSLDLRRSSEGADGEDVVDDENGSVESFDSALERIAAASTGSPEAPSSPLFQPAETIQQVALKRLNLLNSGVSSLETTLLENVSPAEFKTRVAQIGQSLGLSADNEDVQYILSVLLPLVKGEENEAVEDVVDVGGDGADDSNIADGADASKQENSSQMASNGDIEVHPAKEFQSEDVGYEANAIKNSTTTCDIEGGSSERNLPEDMPKNSVTNLESEESAAVKQAIEIGNYEQEPEVIEWEDLNESDVDDVTNFNVQPLPAEIKVSKEITGGEGMDAAGLQQESETTDEDHESKTSAIEGVEKGVAKLEPEVDSSMENNVVDSAEQHRDDSEEEAREPVEHADTPVESKEVTEDSAYGSSEVVEVPERLIASGDLIKVDKEVLSGEEKDRGDTDSKSIVAEEQPFAEGMAERKDGEAQSRELEVDEGKAETSKAVLPDGSESKADSSLVSDEGTIEIVTLGDTDVSEGPGVAKAAPAAEVQDVNVNETVEGESPLETDESFKGEGSKEESPNIDKTADETVEGESPSEKDESFKREESKESPNTDQTADVLVEEEESVTEHASPKASVGDLNEEKSKDRSLITEKATDASVEGKVSVLEIPPPEAAGAGSKASTAPGNDTASSLGGAGPSLPVRPAGLGRSVPSLEHAPRAAQRSSGVPAATRQSAVTNEENQSSTDVTEGSEDAREKLQMIRVKFLRLAHRLGQSAHNVVVAQVLYRLGLAEQLRGGRGSGRTGAFAFERASVLAEEQEAAGADDLEFGCTIMVLGKSGVGKSATINSLFDEVKSGTNAYSPATNKVQEIIGTVHGIKLRVIDTPGLLTSFADQRRNERIMASVKRFIKKSPPDIVLYFDRLDMQSRDYGDLPLLRTITDTFGSAVWFNAIVVLTHASSAPPDGANGVPVSYEMFVAQRSHVVQQTIRQAAGDMRLMNPVSLVENHAACRRNRAGERVLPNGQVWKPQLLLLCFASKILAEANSLLKLQDSSPAKPFGVRSRVPPLPFLLSSLLQSRAQLKLPDEQIGSDDESEDESEDEADSEGEEEYDDLPPFRRLTKDELKLLDKEQRRIYAEELEYREKLFMKKQLKDERARKKEMKRRLAALPKDMAQYSEESLEEENASGSVPIPMPDMALPPSFDSDNPTHRYRYLDTGNQWLVRPVLETHGWDHDSGYDGLNVEKMFVVSKKIPVSVSGQVTKDKKEANLQMECAASFKNGEGKVTQTGLDIQTIGKDLAYTLRSETRFDNFKRNKTTCGLAVTLLGDTVAAGMKIEDRLLIGKRVKLVFNGGALTGRGDVAYGGSLEATIRDKDYPIGQFLSTFGLSVMDWHGDLAIGGNLQVQCKVGKTMTIVRGNLNNRRAGQVSIRVSSSEQLQMALIGLIPLLRTFINNRILSSN